MKIRVQTVALPAIAILFAMAAGASNHHDLNGTWMLVPDRSDFGGEPAIQTGTITINDRQHNIYVSRTFGFSGEQGTFAYNFSMDGAENSTIHEGKSMKCKARWEGDVLKVTVTQDGVTSVERYSLGPDGSMRLEVERPGHPAMHLMFTRSAS